MWERLFILSLFLLPSVADKWVSIKYRCYCVTGVGDSVKIRPWRTLADGQFSLHQFVLTVLTKVVHKEGEIWPALCWIDSNTILPCEVMSLCFKYFSICLQRKSLPAHPWKQWLSSEQFVLVKVGHSLPGPPFFFFFSCHRCSQRSVYHQLWSVGVTVEEWSSLTREWLVFFCMLVNPPDIQTFSTLFFISVNVMS